MNQIATFKPVEGVVWLDVGGSGFRIWVEDLRSPGASSFDWGNDMIHCIESTVKPAPTAISVCISGDVRDGKYLGWLACRGLAEDYFQTMAIRFKCPVFAEGDAICWAAGLTLAFTRVIGNNACLCLVFGSGIASALVDAEGGIMPLDLLSLPLETVQAMTGEFPEYSPSAEGIHNSMAHCYKEFLLLQGVPILEVGRKLAERWSALFACLLQGAEEPWCVLVGGGLTNLVQAEDLKVPAPHRVFMSTDATVGMHGAWKLSGFNEDEEP